MQKKRLHTRKYFHPRFFCTSVNCTSSFKRNLKTGFEIKIRGKFLFKIHSAKTKKYVFSAFFVNFFFKHSILFFFSFLRKIRNPQVGASHFPKRWAGNLWFSGNDSWSPKPEIWRRKIIIILTLLIWNWPDLYLG